MSGATSSTELEQWLDELPALAAALDVDAPARRILLSDAASDARLIEDGRSLHPVLLARGHLAQAAIQLLLADAGDGEDAAKRCLEECAAAFETSMSLAACGPRLRLLPPVGAIAASAMAFLRHSDRRAASRLLSRVAEASGEALDEQRNLADRGVAGLAAGAALADGAAVVSAEVRPVVRARAAEIVRDAHRDLVRAGEMAKAREAEALVAALEG